MKTGGSFHCCVNVYQKVVLMPFCFGSNAEDWGSRKFQNVPSGYMGYMGPSAIKGMDGDPLVHSSGNLT